MVRVEQLPPAPVTELARALRRADDVGEEHGREHTVRLRCLPNARQELADLFEHLVGSAAGPRHVARTGQLDVAGAFDVGREKPGILHVTDTVVDPVHDQCRYVN